MTAKVLIIEDSMVQAMRLQDVLEEHGLAVRCAHYGETGIELARQWLPDAVVLDIKMPAMDGFEVCRRLLADVRTANIPIITLSGTTTSDVRQQSLDLGVVEYIPKGDFAYAVLLETLRQLHILGPEEEVGIGDWEIRDAQSLFSENSSH
ncbi:MAG: response regulator [Anaerolineae bacterium]|nr:response regulator [Anaerolineae bacterium]